LQPILNFKIIKQVVKMKKKIVINKNMCPQNHPCPTVNICPVGAITQSSPFSAPEINEEKCTGCGICTTTCFAFTCHGC
jgi:Fe-S-cluster-containing hydrogenase component 2